MFHLLRWDSTVKASLDTLNLRRKDTALRIKVLRDMNTSEEEDLIYAAFIEFPIIQQSYEDLLEHRHFTIYNEEDLQAYDTTSAHVHVGITACLREIAILKKEDCDPKKGRSGRSGGRRFEGEGLKRETSREQEAIASFFGVVRPLGFILDCHFRRRRVDPRKAA
jgi:hypothetical protein